MKKDEILAKVKRLLNDHPEVRNSDSKLIATFYHDQALNKSGEQFLFEMYCGRLVMPETIVRLRRYAQVWYPEFRGTDYAKRHKKAEKVKKDLGYGH